MRALDGILLTDLADVATAARDLPLDAVVIGGGPTGVAAARTLCEAGHRVALLEAGPLAVLTHASTTDLRFNGNSVRALQDALSYSPRNADGTRFGSLVGCLGGRGVFWTGAAPRFLSTDFEAWPISAEELESSYEWAERDLFVTCRWGMTALAETAQRLLRVAKLPAEPEPFAIDASDSVDGWLSGTIGNPLASLLRSRLLTGPPEGRHLLVATGAFAVRLDRSVAEGPIELLVRDEATEHTIDARSVVLAAGGYESVRLAITSGLPDESGLMGRRLSDHWFARAYFPLAPEIYDPNRPEAGAVLVRPAPDRPYQLELHLPARRFFLGRADSGWAPAPTDEYSAMVRAFAPARNQDTSWLEVTVPDQPGGYTVHIEPTPADAELLARMGEGLGLVRDALGAQEAHIETYPLGSSYHEAGGLQMGELKGTGVVDPFGRFWSDPRVVVVDASAWPAVSCANPHLTLVAIARRQATHLAEELKR